MILLLQNFKVSVCQNPLSTRSKGSWQLGTMSAIHMMNKELKKHVGKSHGWRSLKGWSPWGRWELDTTERPHFHFLVLCIGERNGNPLQCSCLENPRDGGAWWAAIYGVTEGLTRLKRLSSSSSRQLLGFPGGSYGKESFCNAGNLGLIPGSGIFPGEGNGNPLQYS